MDDLNCWLRYGFICETYAACTNNTFGANCLEKCSPNCGGLNNACDNFNGFCFNGCDDGYLGERCGAQSDKTPFVFNFLAFIIGYTLGLLLLTCIIVALGPKSEPEDKDAENGLEAGEEMDNLFDLPVINNLSEPEYSNTESIYDTFQLFLKDERSHHANAQSTSGPTTLGLTVSDIPAVLEG
ncbi:hypothetical protein RRG08_000288 [Elysia crispata]|uniref:Uncharacterized protein n=1 Tax=Elysia crispata TaxID=231223 RepID=A0AAE0ZNP0_9GAST|nr:hypothetical protein RRG08_000288 [Elysia crispata]